MHHGLKLTLELATATAPAFGLSNWNSVGKVQRLQYLTEKINENGPMNHFMATSLTKELQELHENENAHNECCNKTFERFPI